MLNSRKLSYSDLLPYQHRMIDHILEHDSCALWVDMGLGKTVSTLTALQTMKNGFDIENTLVVAPLRVARKTWTDEIQTWAHLNGMTTSKIIGTAQQRLSAARSRADIHLINRENLEWLSMFFMEYDTKKKRWVWVRKWPWDCVVLDEASSFKSQSSNRTQAMMRLRHKVNRIIQLTGTPAPNGLTDLWSQGMLMDRGIRLGNTEKAFQKRFFDPPDFMHGKWTPKPGAEQHIHNAMKGIALSLRAADYLDLPEIVYNRIRVELSASEMKQYRKFRKDCVMDLAGKTVTAVNAGALYGKLLQLSNGAVYTSHPTWEEFHRHKVAALMELHESLEHKKMIVVYNFIPDLKRITKAFDKAGLSWRLLKTEQDEEDWNNGVFDRLVMHPASAGHGTNLYYNGVEDLVWFGLTPNLEWYLQANARIMGGHRAMGKQPRIHHIVADETHDDVVEIGNIEKSGYQHRLMEATKEIIREFA